MRNFTKFFLTGLFFSLLLSGTSFSQQKIDSSFPFQTDPAKKYSLYIPSNYSPALPHKTMLGLHPFNTARWNAISWRDTLTDFAEANGLILICPDGGPDGRIDDPIDTAFTSALLDSVNVWYNLNPQKLFVMGFSWGGLTTYTYGLKHHTKFAGFMPIGAAINGTGAFASVLSNASGKPFFLIHGSLDNPNNRFFPALTGLSSNGAIIDSTYLPGVGHTIDFANRNQILGDAFHWLDSVSSTLTGVIQISNTLPDGYSLQQNYPNPFNPSTSIRFSIPESGFLSIVIFDMTGREVKTLINGVTEVGSYEVSFDAGGLSSGIYYYKLVSGDFSDVKKMILLK